MDVKNKSSKINVFELDKENEAGTINSNQNILKINGK